MSRSIEYKGYVVHTCAFPLAEGGWGAYYLIVVQWSGQYVHEVTNVVKRETSDSACVAALILGLQYVDMTLPEVSD